ncbi:hypothetical protein [Pseudanabaena sp. PCC 6802]|uniref:hypothetical protein n=1 Tax=Pseudanabaena sp. PCC 6802 TaxID=118173 RepID=UPI0003776248|nr:hypothetical protein [Pseudanabaena sp. PCC 6802]
MPNKISLLLASIYLFTGASSAYADSKDWLELSRSSNGIIYMGSKPSRVPKQRDLVNYSALIVPIKPFEGVMYSAMIQFRGSCKAPQFTKVQSVSAFDAKGNPLFDVSATLLGSKVSTFETMSPGNGNDLLLRKACEMSNK